MPFEHKKIESETERRIVTGMVVSDDFLSAISHFYNPQYFESDLSKIVTRWCMEYWSDYGKAPKATIQDIYNNKKSYLKEETADIILEFLLSLSNQHGQDFDVEYSITLTEEYFRKKKLFKAQKDIEDFLAENQIDEAESYLQELSQQTISTKLSSEVENVSISSGDLLKESIPRPRKLLAPWLTESSLSMVYAQRGVGKTWLCLAISVILTRENCEDLTIGYWKVKHPTGVFYVDGEMGDSLIQSRLGYLTKPLGKEHPDSPLVILTSNRMARKFRKQINIADSKWRAAIYDYLSKHDEIGVVVFDNISALAFGLDENNKQDWDSINQWLISLKDLGLAIILVHHAGKGNKQRGTSAREDALDCVIQLNRPPAKNGYSKGGAKFRIVFEKARNLGPDANIYPFDLQFVEGDLPDELTWKIPPKELD